MMERDSCTERTMNAAYTLVFPMGHVISYCFSIQQFNFKPLKLSLQKFRLVTFPCIASFKLIGNLRYVPTTLTFFFCIGIVHFL